MNFQERELKTVESTMKVQTGSEEQDIPAPAPGENVYPIYSNGAICGYIYSGGDQKTHKIFLNGDNQPSSSEDERLTRKRKNVVLMKNTFVNKICKKTGAEIQPTNPNSQKGKNLLTAKPPSEKHIKSEPLADSASKNNVPLPVLDMLRANKDTLLIENPTEARTSLLKKQRSNPEQPVTTPISLAPSLSSNVTNLADKMMISSKTTPSSNDKVIFSPSLNTNSKMPIMLSSNNSVLQPKNCLAATGQPTNWVTTPGQPTNWVTTPGQPTNWVTTPGQPTNWVTAPGQPTNWVTATGQPTNWLTAPGQSTWPANTVTYVLMSAGQAPVYLGNSPNALTRILPKNTTVPARTNISTATTTATTTATATIPVPIRPAERSAVPNFGGQLSSLKEIKAKSTFVQLPIQVSTLANNKMNISDPNQSIVQSVVPQKLLKHTNLENKEKLSQIPLSMNIGVLRHLIQPNKLKPETNNHLPAAVVQSSDINSVTTVEKPSNDSSSSPCEILNNEVTTELSKTGQNVTKDSSNLMAESCEKDKSTTSENNKALLSKENNVYDPSSILEKIKVFLAKPTTNKLFKDRPRKFLVPSKYKYNKQIPVLPATENTGIGVTSKLSGFNLPSGNYVIHSEEVKTDLSQSETEKLLTCRQKDNGSEHESIKRRPSLEGKMVKNGEKVTIKTEPLDDESGGNQGYSLSVPCTSSVTSFPANIGIKRKNTNEEKIIIKTEPLDNESGSSQDHNLSDQCVSSTASFPADIEIKTEHNSEIKSTPATKEKNEDNELVISSCFSLSINSEDERKLPFDATNSNLNNLFFLPQQANFEDSNDDVPNENSTNVAKKPKLSEFPVVLDASDSSSDSLILSTAEETQIPCGKKLHETSPCKSIIDPEYVKKFKENDSSDDKTKSSASLLELNKASLKPKLIGSPEENQIPSTKKWHEVSPYKSIINPEYFKKLKENNLSDRTKILADPFELNKEPLKSKLIGSPEEKQIPCAKKWYEVSSYKSIINPDYVKKLKEKDLSDDKTKISADPFEVNKASLSAEVKQTPCVKKWYEVSPYKSIINQDYLKKLKEKDLYDDKRKISVDPSKLNEAPDKTKLITISENILTTPSCVDKALTSDKNLAPRLLPTDDFLIDNLTKDKEADSFLEGRIAFHQQQLNLLQLQVDQHKTTLEKLKKAQNYLRELT